MQPYLCSVLRGVEVFSSEQSIAKFHALEPIFGTVGLSDVYSPWDQLHHFGRIQSQNPLDTIPTGSREAPRDPSQPGSSKVLDPFHVPKPGRRRSLLMTEQKLTKAASRLNKSLDNPNS